MALDLYAARDEAAMNDEEEERVEVFTLNGTTYSAPVRPRVNVALKYMRTMRRGNPDMAIAGLIEDIIGAEGYEALVNYDELTPAQFQAVLMACRRLVMGEMEEAAEKGGS